MTIMNKTMKRLVSLILALTFCFALAMQVYATTDGQTEEPAADAMVEETPALVQENLDAALIALLLKLDADQTAQYGATLNTMNTPANVRQDIVDALSTCVQCMDENEAAKTRMEEIKQKIQNNTQLDDIRKENILKDLEDAWMKAEFLPVEHLMTQLEALALDPAVVLTTVEMESNLEDLQDLNARLDAAEVLVNTADQLPLIDAAMERLRAFAGAESEATGAMEETLLLEVDEFARRREEVGKELDKFLDKTPQEQGAVLEEISNLKQELESYPTLMLVDTVRYADSITADLDLMEKALEETQSKMIFGIIALILAAIGILMAIVVAVFALGKARGEKLDVGTLASREDVDAVSRQNKQLKAQNDQLGLRMEAIIREVDVLKAKSVVKAEPKIEPKIETKPESKIETKPEPVKPILGSDQQVGVLKMNYQFINPANSYLTENPAGKVILFSDDTVELAPSEMNITNELNGWINKGVFYLFEVEVDGKIVDPQWDKLPAGHHYITATIRRPVVKNMGNGSYIILSKGHIRMSK